MTSRTQDTGVDKKSNILEGKRLAFAICGGIGAVDSVRSIRELRRHGAEILPYLSRGATEFITQLSVSWAANQEATVKMGSRAEHLRSLDGVVVAPATLNTISKAALGISDSVVSLLLASQLGRQIPIIMVPTMNAEMAGHPVYPEHRATLEKFGVSFYPSPVEENRLKMPDPEKLAEFVLKAFSE